MATLYVENVPDDLYQALKEQAKQQRRSVAQHTIALLAHSVPSPQELDRRRKLFQDVLTMQAQKPLSEGPFESSEETIAKDRAR